MISVCSCLAKISTGAKSAGIDPVDLQTDIQELHRKLDWLAEALVAGGDSDTARKKKLPDEPVTV